jgi:hypothetical protein
MSTESLHTPVAFFVFNRPGTTRRVFEAIARAKPEKLLLIADGPRPDREGEAEGCGKVREIVAQVDWPCEVLQNFSQRNLGCAERMISGLNWVFSVAEEAIVLEDDCLPDQSFFYFCQELLERYRGDDRVSYISGDNLIGSYRKPTESYYFSRIGGIWGWATWRSEWLRYDRHLGCWPEVKSRRLLEEIFDEPEVVQFWTRIFDAMYEKRGPDTWDYQWLYTGLKNNSISAVPSVNLVANIGFGAGATHTIGEDTRFMLSAVAMEFPLRHPVSYIPLSSLDQRRIQDMLPPSRVKRIWNRLRRFGGKIRP